MRTVEDFLPWVEMMRTFTFTDGIKTIYGDIYVGENVLTIPDCGSITHRERNLQTETFNVTMYTALTNNFFIYRAAAETTHIHKFMSIENGTAKRNFIPYPCTEEVYFQLSTTQEMHHPLCVLEFESYERLERISLAVEPDWRILITPFSKFSAMSDHAYETITQALQKYIAAKY